MTRVAPSRQLYAFAHRGGAAHGPGNQLDTFRRALALGATGLETDAWVTADGAVVLDHDGLHRAGRRRGRPIAEVRRDELPAHVPTLDQLYSACGAAFDLAVDVRRPEVAAAVVEVARAHDAAPRLWLVAAAHHLMDGWRGLGDDVHLALSIRLVERSRATVRAAAAAGAEAVNMRWPWWTRRYVDLVHGEGMLAFGYDVQRERTMRHCLRLGLDGLFSDHVERLQHAVAG
jgi:glycerophosphoryl diester phosphodiesterase